MKSLLTVFTLVLATATVIQAQQNVLESYLKYLMPHIEPCAEEHQISNDEYSNIQMVAKGGSAMEKLACLRSCVMKKMGAMVDNKIHLDVINAMIDVVHAGKADEIEAVKKIAADCAPDAESQGEECKIGMRYTDCYVTKLMGGSR